MQLPKRRSDANRVFSDPSEPLYLTPGGKTRLERTLADLKKRQEPQARKDVAEAVAKGDLSENAEYQEARPRLTRIQSRILSITEQLKRVVLIEPGGSDAISLGSTVKVDMGGEERTYRIVGPRETDPGKGYISHESPIGSALLTHRAGETVTVHIGETDKQIRIIEIR